MRGIFAFDAQRAGNERVQKGEYYKKQRGRYALNGGAVC